MTNGTKLDFQDKVFTVAEYIDVLNTFFKAQAVKITGEICELKRAVSGHIYFTIKDKANAGVMDCIIWSRNYEMCGVALEIGMEVILSGHANVYPPSGRLSFVADTVELVGEGALKKAYDDLKKKLELEGVFAESRKRELPDYVQRIGVITSMKGAVIHDFENNLGKFGFVVNVIDSRVEGQQAVKPLLAAVAAMRKLAEGGEKTETTTGAAVTDGGLFGGVPSAGTRDTISTEGPIEVLVIIRGGGSLESLQAFNNEALVRAIVDFPVPVIAGIGHDQDVPLMALAADYMTSTPTAAAHLLTKSWRDAYNKLQQIPYLLARVDREIQRIRKDLELAWSSMIDHTENQIRRIHERLAFAEQTIRLNDPTRQLKLGYSIMRQNGKVIKSVDAVEVGSSVTSELADGTITARVEKK